MDEQLQQLIARLQQAQNILVTVSKNPSVDQLSAAIGLTLALNKLGKHGTAVFSGKVPSTLEFLKPEKTIEKNTDSLRDFIIALDKSKADKLRYKVEDDVVRIFITPYRTSISDKDLQFSQGDFNVDVVICLGVTEQQDLDGAITAHGRILHDATVACMSVVGQGSLGGINWVDPTASSLSEMVVAMTDSMDKSVMDNQIATALLTGIVATTERFRNDKTTPRTMSASAELMAAGANQQLIATELEPEVPVVQTQADAQGSTDKPSDSQDKPAGQPPKPEPGTLEIEHEAEPTPEPDKEPAKEAPAQVSVDENGQLVSVDTINSADTQLSSEEPAIRDVKAGGSAAPQPPEGKRKKKRERMTEQPKTVGSLTANTTPEQLDPPTEELSLPSPLTPPLLSHNDKKPADMPVAKPVPQPAPADWQPPEQTGPESETLTDIERSVDSPHLLPAAPAGQSQSAILPPAPLVGSDLAPTDPLVADTSGAATPTDESNDNLDSARNAVEAALSHAGPQNNPLAPIEALNAQPLGPELQPPQPPAQPAVPAPSSPFTIPSQPMVSQSLPPVPNSGFSEPTPGNSPADETLDMPLPPSGFGSQPSAPAASPFGQSLPPTSPNVLTPSAFPGAPQPANSQQGNGPTPPPVPPPMLPPLQ